MDENYRRGEQSLGRGASNISISGDGLNYSNGGRSSVAKREKQQTDDEPLKIPTALKVVLAGTGILIVVWILIQVTRRLLNDKNDRLGASIGASRSEQHGKIVDAKAPPKSFKVVTDTNVANVIDASPKTDAQKMVEEEVRRKEEREMRIIEEEELKRKYDQASGKNLFNNLKLKTNDDVPNIRGLGRNNAPPPPTLAGLGKQNTNGLFNGSSENIFSSNTPLHYNNMGGGSFGQAGNMSGTAEDDFNKFVPPPNQDEPVQERIQTLPATAGTTKIAAKRQPVLAGETEQESRYINSVCPLPYELKAVSTSDKVSCYKNCPIGFVVRSIDPMAENADLTKRGKDAYFACVAECPIVTDEEGNIKYIDVIDPDTGEPQRVPQRTDAPNGNACSIRRQRRKLGFGAEKVKCMATRVSQGVIDNLKRVTGRKRFNAPRAFSSRYGTLSPEERKDIDANSAAFNNFINNDYEFARSDNYATTVGDYCEAHFMTDNGLNGYSSKMPQLTYDPTACGETYDLMFTRPASYFSNQFNGLHVPSRCYENCPAGDVLLPAGAFDEHLCLESCPPNTRMSPVSPGTECVKDGFKQEISIFDLTGIVMEAYRGERAVPKKT